MRGCAPDFAKLCCLCMNDGAEISLHHGKRNDATSSGQADVRGAGTTGPFPSEFRVSILLLQLCPSLEMALHGIISVQSKNHVSFFQCGSPNRYISRPSESSNIEEAIR